MKENGRKASEEESIYILASIYDPLLIHLSPPLGILQHRHLALALGSHTPPFALIGRPAAAFVCALCGCLGAVFGPLRVGTHDSRTVVAIPVEVRELGIADKTFPRPSSEYSQCSRTYHLASH